MPFSPDIDYRGSEADTVRKMIHGDTLPPARKGYIIANFALLQFATAGGSALAAELTGRAFLELTCVPSELDPPLPEDLRRTLDAHREHVATQGAHLTGAVSRLLLTAAVDHGTSQTVHDYPHHEGAIA